MFGSFIVIWGCLVQLFIQSRRGLRIYLVSRESRMFLNKLIHIWSNSSFFLFSRSPVPARVPSHVLVIQPPGQTLPGHPNPCHACLYSRSRQSGQGTLHDLSCKREAPLVHQTCPPAIHEGTLACSCVQRELTLSSARLRKQKFSPAPPRV